MAEKHGQDVLGHLDWPQDGQPLRGIGLVTGWVLTDDPHGLFVEVVIEGRVVATAAPSLARPDVHAVYPQQAAANPTPGFLCVLNTIQLTNSTHRLRCVARHGGGVATVGEVEVRVDNTDSMVPRMIDPRPDMTFLGYQLPDAAYIHPAMLNLEERVLPAYLAREAAALPGALVELGCFLGGSTVAILDGLRQAGALAGLPGPRLHSYDLFVAIPYMVDHSLGQHGVKAGESFEHVFRSLLGDDARFVSIHPGDIRRETWAGGPIALLYVDILWDWGINHHVINQFYRRLAPGSWLIHQDFIFSMYPWLPVSMEWFIRHGYFSIHSYAEFSTVSFRCEKALDDIPESFDFAEALSLEEKRELIRAAADRFVGYPKALIQMSECILLDRAGHSAEARHRLDEIAASGTHRFVRMHTGFVTSHLSGTAA